MNKKQLFMLFILSLIPFVIYSFNSSFAGADTWFYLSRVCDKSIIDFRDPLFDIVSLAIPCNFVIIKMYLALLFFGFVYFSAKIGELYFKENGWLMGLISGFLTMGILEFMVFENDSLGYVLALMSIYFALKTYKTYKYKFTIDSCLSIIFIVAAGLAWKGAIYWLYPLILFNPYVLIVTIPTTLLNIESLLWFVDAGGSGIAEQTPLLSIIYYGVTIFFMYGFIKTPKKEVVSAIILIIPGLFVLKLYMLAIPFISIIALHGINILKPKLRQNLISSMIILTVMFALFWGVHSFNEFPTEQDIALVQDTKNYTKSVQNDFGIGYILEYYDIQTTARGGTLGKELDYNCVGYVVEHPLTKKCECTEINKTTNLILQQC